MRSIRRLRWSCLPLTNQRRLALFGVAMLCWATLAPASARASVVWSFAATDPARPGAHVDGTITFENTSPHFAPGDTASLGNGAITSYAFTYTDRSGASNVIASSAADTGPFGYLVFQPLAVTFGASLAPADVRQAAYWSLAASGNSSFFNSLDLRLAASGAIVTAYAASAAIYTTDGSFKLGAPIDVCGDITVSARRNSDGVTRLDGFLSLALPEAVSVAAIPPESIDRVELRYRPPQGVDGVCSYVRHGSVDGYPLASCSTGARGGSVIRTSELGLRILGGRNGAVASASLQRVNCVPNVATLPPMTGPPDGSRGIDSAGLLTQPLPLSSSRTNALLPPPSDWEAIPAGQTGTARALFSDTGLIATQPLAAATLGKQSFVFAVGADGHVYFQVLDASSLAWSPSWSEVPGGLVTDRRVAAAATKDTLFLFARDARTGALSLNKRKLGCPGGTAVGCWAGWGTEALPIDFGPSSFTAAAGDREVYLITNGPYALAPSSRFVHALRVSVRGTSGGWGPYWVVTLAGESPGTFTPVRSDSWPAAAAGPTLDLRIYGVLRSLGGDPLSRALGPARLSLYPGDTVAWRACSLPTRNLPAPLSGVTPSASDVDGAEALFALDAAGRVDVRNASGDECPAWSVPSPIPELTMVAAESPAVARFDIGGRTTRFLIAVRDTSGIARFQILTSLRLQALRVADGDGSNRASVTPAEFAAWVAEANRVYAPARLWLVFAPALDFENRDDGALNATNECDKKVTYSTACIADAYANSVAAFYPRRVLVLVRFGSDVGDIDLRNRIPAGGGWSWYDYDFVVMPGFPVTTVCSGLGLQNIGLLAHELGHHLGLWHTFRGDAKGNPFTPATATAWLRDFGNEYFLAFDGDAPSGVADTSPDPSVDFSGAAGGSDEFCRAPDATISITTSVGTVTWTPPRLDAMSYYNPLDASGALLPHTLSADQVRRVYDNLPF